MTKLTRFVSHHGAARVTSLIRICCVSLFVVTANVSWGSGEFVDLYPKTVEDLQIILDTLEEGIPETQTDETPPIVVMLHGEEAHHFIRGNYQANKAIVDQTAKLAAYDVIDVKICETWMRMNNYRRIDLFPFVSPVPYGASELNRLRKEEGYEDYSTSL